MIYNIYISKIKLQSMLNDNDMEKECLSQHSVDVNYLWIRVVLLIYLSFDTGFDNKKQANIVTYFFFY